MDTWEVTKVCDAMTFPDTAEEFMEQYKIVDTERVYTNGAELIPIFRVRQWLEHLQDIEPERKTGYWVCKIGYNVKLYMCSACNGWSNTNACRYCPNCGARMED